MKTIALKKIRGTRKISVAKGEAAEIFLDVVGKGRVEFTFGEGSESKIFVKVSNGSRSAMRLVLGKNALVKIASCSMGASEEETEILQKGDWSRCEHYAIGFAKGRQKLLKRSSHSHFGKKTYSRTSFKFVAAGSAAIELRGKVTVEQDARGADTHLALKGLVLGNETEMILMPLLGVYNKEVSAGHGAASGPVDKEGLFYLQSRGIAEKEAVVLMAKGFLREIMSQGKFSGGIALRMEQEIDNVVW